ncbi:hypothetical protein OCU04_010203 [Sclerotinia nivalis]|uniref:Cell cycle control protein cwf19 n=1 Tax=Sclerotinia nivalis TaxID=352851 RepID=A0A9X0DFN5_9HELO|nr:hypothetical protein OCU04_010203 [Sclerotinia nivalis]
MDGLDEFEKSLAAEKAEREKSERSSRKDKDRKHRHHHRSRHHRSKEDDDEDRDDHRHKRSRHSRHDDEDDDDRRKRKHEKLSDPKEDLPIPDEEEAEVRPKVIRDSWMTDPSAFEFDYTQKGSKKPTEPKVAPRPDYDLKIHKKELNHHLQDLNEGVKKLDDIEAGHEVDYTFGDSGAQWRMTKLKAVYTQAEQSGKPIDEVAIARFGGLREFDDAREEQIELDRRRLYGKGYVGKEKPSGELFQERKLDLGIRRGSAPQQDEPAELPQGKIMEETSAPSIQLDATALNRLKAQMMKAKLKKSPDAARLEAEYNAAASAGLATTSEPGVVVLGKMDNRMLAGTRGEVKSIDNKRGRERGLVEENEDMTIEDMVREERRTKGQVGGDGMRAAERIAKDAKFDNDLDYMDDNANKLAKRVQKSEINLRNTAIGDFQKMNRILDSCQLCHHEDKNQPPVAPIVSLATRVYLTLPTEPELSDGGAVIVPIQHRTNLLECDDDEWEEIRNFMKCLTRMYHDQGRDVVFYENAATPHRKMHAAMQAVPLPYSLGETAPAFFKEAILSSDEEWTQHKKLIDTAARARDGLGKLAFRRSIAKEMPYFHAWFDLDGGLGHIVEDANRWPRGDLFAREIIGGMLDIEPDVIKRQGRWSRGGDKRLEGFRNRWKKFDWTKVLTDE